MKPRGRNKLLPRSPVLEGAHFEPNFFCVSRETTHSKGSVAFHLSVTRIVIKRRAGCVDFKMYWTIPFSFLPSPF